MKLGVLVGIFMLPFIVLAIIVPLIIQRYSSDYASKGKEWGYFAAMLIDFGIWFYISDISPSLMLKKSGILALVVIGYLIFQAVRSRRRYARS